MVAGSDQGSDSLEAWEEKTAAVIDWMTEQLRHMQAVLVRIWQGRPDFLDAW